MCMTLLDPFGNTLRFKRAPVDQRRGWLPSLRSTL